MSNRELQWKLNQDNIDNERLAKIITQQFQIDWVKKYGDEPVETGRPPNEEKIESLINKFEAQLDETYTNAFTIVRSLYETNKSGLGTSAQINFLTDDYNTFRAYNNIIGYLNSFKRFFSLNQQSRNQVVNSLQEYLPKIEAIMNLYGSTGNAENYYFQTYNYYQQMYSYISKGLFIPIRLTGEIVGFFEDLGLNPDIVPPPPPPPRGLPDGLDESSPSALQTPSFPASPPSPTEELGQIEETLQQIEGEEGITTRASAPPAPPAPTFTKSEIIERELNELRINHYEIFGTPNRDPFRRRLTKIRKLLNELPEDEFPDVFDYMDSVATVRTPDERFKMMVEFIEERIPEEETEGSGMPYYPEAGERVLGKMEGYGYTAEHLKPAHKRKSVYYGKGYSYRSSHSFIPPAERKGVSLDVVWKDL